MRSTRLAIVLKDVTKTFALGHGEGLQVLNIPALELTAGSYTVLKGPSGSGKTTLLNLLAGITTPSSGQIYLDATDLFALPEARRDRFRAEHIGYVFQTFNLLASLTALENILLAMMFTAKLSKQQQRQRAITVLSKLGLSARLSHRPHQLSRGEQQRVAIARALANDPPLILADEPCASLDPKTAQVVMAEFQVICREEQKTVLVVSHEETAVRGADRLLDMTAINRAVGSLP
jgi:ABC-type lipoprotein export system ATPase subunit